MSKSTIEKVTCPVCVKESEFVIWNSINTMLDPELKEQVRNKELFIFTCPHCKNRTMVEYACLYHQMEDQRMIYYVPGDMEEAELMLKGKMRNDLGEIEDMPMREMTVGYTNRVVGSMNEFQEKLHILDAGLDDKYIEIMKIFMIAQLQEKDKTFSCEEFLFEKDGNVFRFAIRLEDGRWGTTEFAKGLYDCIVREFAEKVQDDEVIIDRQWALSKL